MWIQIAVMLARWLGPILLEAFLKWLERRLKEKAAQLSEHSEPVEDTVEARVTLLEAVRSDLYFWQVGKKRACDQCIAAVRTGQLPVGLKVG